MDRRERTSKDEARKGEEDRNRKTVHYLVEWKGYENDASQNTWEPLRNLHNASTALRKFRDANPTKPFSS